MAARKLLIVLLAGSIWACTETPMTPPSANEVGQAALSANATPSTAIVIDASRDGGGWWFPQGGGSFDPSLPHQGKALADTLRNQGMVVDELPRPSAITCEQLGQYSLVVEADAYLPYSPTELDAYYRFVSRGGRLIMLEDYNPSNLPALFGLQAAGSIQGNVTTFAPHPITAGVVALFYGVGSAVTAAPVGFTALGWLAGMPVMGIMPVGLGEVFFIGDINGIERVPQPFVDNLFGYMLAGAQPVFSCPVSSPTDILGQISVLNLGVGERTSLTSPLNAASAAIARGNTTAAVHQLRAFINQVEALERGGQLDPLPGAQLVTLANELIDQIS